jgi:hypothetical protein
LNKKIISFSGPLTTFLEELKLLDDKNLVGISKLTPLITKTKVSRFAGGIFISKKMLKNYNETLFFYDKSIDLTKTFKRSAVKSYIELDTRDIDPFEVLDYILKKISPHLSNCGKEIQKFKANISKIDRNLKANFTKKKIVFFLGSITRAKKLPELVISNDGFVKYLRVNKLIDTYKSEFAYVSWSQKELNKLKKTHYLIGVNDSENKTTQVQTISKRYLNILLRGALVPGIRQVYLLKKISELNL